MKIPVRLSFWTVNEILVEDGKVAGVRLEDNSESDLQ